MIKMTEKPLYLDANALIRYYSKEEGTLSIRRAFSVSKNEIFISSLTILEFLGVIVKFRRSGKLRKYELKNIVKRLRRDTNKYGSNRTFTHIKFPKSCFKLAETLLIGIAENVSIGANDCIHVAIVKNSEIEMRMVSSDTGLKKICSKINIEVFDPLF